MQRACQTQIILQILKYFECKLMMSIQILKHPRAAANTGERVLWCRSVRHHRIVAVTPAAENRVCQEMKSSTDYRTPSNTCHT